jgi:hypothetical protein
MWERRAVEEEERSRGGSAEGKMSAREEEKAGNKRTGFFPFWQLHQRVDEGEHQVVVEVLQELLRLGIFLS